MGPQKIITATLILFIAGVKVSHGQHGLDYKFLVTSAVESRANATGEAFQHIVDSTSVKVARRNITFEGTLRILRADNQNNLRCIPIGKWISSGSYPTISGIGRIHFRDTTNYDSLGNLIRSASYNDKKGGFKLSLKTISEYKNGLLIEYTEHFNDDKLERSHYERVVDFDIPKAYDNKTKIPTGTMTTYKNGKIKVRQTYDTEGKLVTDEKHKR